MSPDFETECTNLIFCKKLDVIDSEDIEAQYQPPAVLWQALPAKPVEEGEPELQIKERWCTIL